MGERIETILDLLRDSPDDVFLHYSLGMEYASAGRHAGAAEAFAHAIELDPDYLPAYVEAGKALRSAEDLSAARERFASAMEIAGVQGETHVQDYVREQLNALSNR